MLAGGAVASLLAPHAVHAQDATWKGTTSGQWTVGTNWSSTPAVPTGVATFTTGAATTFIANSSGAVNIGSLVFTNVPNAPAYTFGINNNFFVNGAGIANNSTSTQTFNVNDRMTFQSGSANSGKGAVNFNIASTGVLYFLNSGSAGGTAISNTNGFLGFWNDSTAGTATITNNIDKNSRGLAFFANSSTAGSAKISNNGYLAFFDNSSAGNAAITTKFGLQFSENSTAGSAVITGSGGVQFSNNSTAGNATITTQDTVGFQNNSTAGSATINGPTTIFTDSSSAGNATITSNLYLAFAGHSTAGNAVITNNTSGTFFELQFGGNSTGGNAAITNGGASSFVDFSSSTGPNADHKLSVGSLAGPGIFYLGANQLTIGGNNLSTIVSGVIADCVVGLNRCNNLLLKGDLSTGGSLMKTGAGTLTLSGVNSYTGGTIISDGTLQLGNGGATGSILGNVLDNANFAINRSDAFIFGAVISGTGAFQQLGTGTTTLTALESYSGLTTIASGTLALSGAGNIASSSGVLANGAFDISGVSGAGTSVQTLSGQGGVALGTKTLTLTNASGNFAGAIGGTGGFTLAAGKETLSGSNIYTGATIVNAGTLSVNGSIAASSLTTVNPGATLGGNGTVGNTTISGGTLAPGNSIGTLTVQGNLVFTAAASYMVEVSPANADRTNVTGTATLGGATVNASFAAGTYVERQYTILNATGGVSGTFNTLANTDLPANFTSSLSYDSNNAYLNLALNFIPPPGSGLSANQQNAANAIVGFFNANAGIPLVFGGLTAAGLTQISGEAATGTQQTTFDAMGMFLGVLTDPFITGRGNPVSAGADAPQFVDEAGAASAYASNGKPRSKSEREAYAAVYRKAPVMADPYLQRWSVWAAGYGGSQTTDGNAVLGSNNTRSSIGGVAVGADYRFSPYTIAGFALAGGATNFSVNGLGSGRSDLFQAGAFVRHNVGAAYLTGALAYGWQDITIDRAVTVAGTDLLRAQFNANAFSGRVEGGYRFVTPWMAMGLTPYAAAQFTSFDLPAYAEQAITGANMFALGYAAKNVTASRSELGLRSDKSFAMQDGIFTLRGRAAWAHNYNPDRNIAATFQTLPGASFVVNGAAQAHDAALVTASAEMKWLNGFSLAGSFEGEFSNVTRSYAGKGVVRYAW
jgi:autotransporter-associated beta strand protein